jgi:hypothetical protein
MDSKSKTLALFVLLSVASALADQVLPADKEDIVRFDALLGKQKGMDRPKVKEKPIRERLERLSQPKTKLERAPEQKALKSGDLGQYKESITKKHEAKKIERVTASTTGKKKPVQAKPTKQKKQK